MHSLSRFTRTLVLLCTSLSAPLAIQAQSLAPAVSLTQSFDTVLSRFETQFIAVARAMPEDKYGFSPSSLPLPSSDFAGVRTFSAQVRHVAEMNFVIYSVMSGLKPDMDEDSIRKLKTKEEIMAALTRSFAFGHKALATLNAANATEVPEDSHGMTRAGIAAYVMVHDADHFGQLSEYLRMNGIIPPQSQK